MKEILQHFKACYICFVERQGFPIIVTVCVVVITATALFTKRNNPPYTSPTPPPVEHVSAAQLLQQSLANAATAAPAPTQPQWCAPLETIAPLRSFDDNTMVHRDSGIWTVHAALDLKATAGAPVFAIGDGEVIAAGDDVLQGAWVTIQHPDLVVSSYAGLSLINDYIAGDPVRRGDTIGFCGPGPKDEVSLGPHLHLRVTRNGQAIDPCSLWHESAE